MKNKERISQSGYSCVCTLSRARYERYESFATYPTGPVPRSWFFVRDRQPSPPPRSPIFKGNKTGKWCVDTPPRPLSSSVTRSRFLNASIVATHSRMHSMQSTGKRSRLLFHPSASSSVRTCFPVMVSGSNTPPTDFVGGVIFSTNTRSMSGRSNRRVAIVFSSSSSS